MARGDDLTHFAAEHGLPFLSVSDVARYRQTRERLVDRVAETLLPTDYGDFRLYGYRETITGAEHVALAMGNVADGEPVLVRYTPSA
jgi:3,4-dihydroxy 2-butanone 4-phosphate synthase/GTP cyclohydrolase II